MKINIRENEIEQWEINIILWKILSYLFFVILEICWNIFVQIFHPN